ncbi:TPA: TlpA family protein disulfide reductase, partial [Candidatus Poribacteria bacterium]|nr:TlpA family protein disulfide reductase [Candidatus Poribacteria bacterium]
QDLHERYFEKLIKKDERGKKEIKGGLVVIGVGLDRSGSKAIKPFAEKAKLTYLLLADPTEKDKSEKLITDAKVAASAYKVRGIPTMYIFDSKGVIRAVHVGFAPGVENLIEKEIKELVKSKPRGK